MFLREMHSEPVQSLKEFRLETTIALEDAFASNASCSSVRECARPRIPEQSLASLRQKP